MRGEVLGRVERRRRWSADEKLAVVMASLEPDAVVASVARQFDVTRQQVYDWRRAARRGELGTPGGVVGFLEVVTGSPSASSAAGAEARPVAEVPGTTPTNGDAMITAAATVEIVLVGGRVLRVSTTLPAAELRRLICAVEDA
jgi:transposase